MHTESYGPSMRSSRGQRGQMITLPNGRVQARYRTGGRDGTRHAKTFDTRREAADWLREQLSDPRAPVREQERTVEQTIVDYLAAHEAAPPTLEKLRRQLVPFGREHGHRLLQSLEPYELAAHRKQSNHYSFRAVKQLLNQSVEYGWLLESPAAKVRNPRPPRREVNAPPWEHVVTLDGEIDRRYEGLAVFAAGTGLRPEEWIALERADLDLEARVVRVRRVFSYGRLVELGADGSKSWRQRRDIPLRQVVLSALANMTPRIDTPLLFPSPGGDYLKLARFGERTWAPALRAAGLPHFPPKDMRHVYASESIAAGTDLFTLSRRMGTSLDKIDENYGHLVKGAVQRELQLLDAWDVAQGRVAQ